MTLKDYLVFIRWKNLLMILLIQLLIKFVLFQKFDLSVSLDNLHFFLLSLSTICIAAAGYIINDIHDIKADLINKPNKVFVGKKISVSRANNLFIAINSIGLLLGFYLSFYINHNSFFIIFILTSLLLYRYAIDLKNRLLIGNVVIAVIVFFSIMIIVVFDIVPATNNYNNQTQIHIVKLLLLISGFAFSLTLLREIIKDLEDVIGDKKINAKTLPIVWGEAKTKKLLFFLSLAIFMGINYFSFLLYQSNLYGAVYLTIIVSLPLLYFLLKINRSKTKNDYHKLSGLLKIIMLLGILTILFL